MDKYQLAQQLECEIHEAEKSLIFWRHQAEILAESDLSATVAAIAEDAELRLRHLRNAQEIFSDT
jgi:hypothetical protein